jgi:hypothetical protein
MRKYKEKGNGKKKSVNDKDRQDQVLFEAMKLAEVLSVFYVD